MKQFLDKFLYNIVPLLVWAAIGLMMLYCYNRCDGGRVEPKDTLSVRVDSFIDTMYVEIHDTVPKYVTERVILRVKVPVDSQNDSKMTDAAENDSKMTASANGDSVNFDVVQREYSDDSTYTAYVSGLLYRDWPRLDSITVRQRTIINTITQTVTLLKRQSRFSISAGIGYGYGIRYKGFEPFIGVTIGYRLLPP